MKKFDFFLGVLFIIITSYFVFTYKNNKTKKTKNKKGNRRKRFINLDPFPERIPYTQEFIQGLGGFPEQPFDSLGTRYSPPDTDQVIINPRAKLVFENFANVNPASYSTCYKLDDSEENATDDTTESWWNWYSRNGKTLNYMDCCNGKKPALRSKKTMENFTMTRYPDPDLGTVSGVTDLQSCLDSCAGDDTCVTSILTQDQYTNPICYVAKKVKMPNDQFDQVYIKSNGNNFYRLSSPTDTTVYPMLTGNSSNKKPITYPIIQTDSNTNITTQVTPSTVPTTTTPVTNSVVATDLKNYNQRTGDFLNRYRPLYKEKKESPNLGITNDIHKIGVDTSKTIQPQINKPATKEMDNKHTNENTWNRRTPTHLKPATSSTPNINYPILQASNPTDTLANVNSSVSTSSTNQPAFDATVGVQQDTPIDSTTELASAASLEASRKAEFPWMEHFSLLRK